MGNWVKFKHPHSLRDHVDTLGVIPDIGQTLIWNGTSFSPEYVNKNLNPKEYTPNSNNEIEIDWTETSFAHVNYDDSYVIKFVNPPRFSTIVYLRLYTTSNVAPRISINVPNAKFADAEIPNPPIPGSDILFTIVYDSTQDYYYVSYRVRYLGKGWKYKLTVTVDNTSSNDLTDVLVPVSITNPTVFAYSADGSDIRVCDTSQNLLDFHVDYWNLDENNIGTLWVKIPSIAANGSYNFEIYLGNPFATNSFSDPSIFIFYDPCQDISGWVKQGSGNVYQDCDYLPYCVIRKDDNGDPNGAYKLIGSSLSTFYLAVRQRRDLNDTAYADRYGLVDSNGDGVGPVLVYRSSGTAYGWDTRDNWTGTYNEIDSLDNLLYKWLRVHFAYDGNTGNFTIKVLDDDLSELASSSNSTNQYSNLDRVYILGGYPYYTSSIVITKYETVYLNVSNITLETLDPPYDNPDWY